jgi:hypothetical protein
MGNVRTLSRSFGGGELTPEMYGRIDDAKYQTGVALCRNFITKPHGPAENRAGFAYVNAVKTAAKRTRLIPFTYSSTQTMVLEFGDGYIRFHTQGATLSTGSVTAWNSATAYTVGALASRLGVNYYCIAAHTNQQPPNATYWYALTGSTYEIPTPYAEADLFDLHYVQSADVLTIVHPNYPPRELRRYGATNWQLSTISFASTLSAPGSVGVTATGFRTYATGTSGTNTVTVESTAGLYLGQTVQGIGIGAGATVTKIVFSTGVVTLSVNNSGSVGSIINFYGPTTYSYVVTAVGSTGIDESLPSSVVTCTNYLPTANTSNYITWNAVSGAQRYRVYRLFSGLYCYIGQTDQLNFLDENITPDIGLTVPISNNPFASSGNYPAAVSYFEQRRCFAGTANLPQTLWMTRTGTESNMSYSLPTQDDDAISFRVAAREANTIRHIVPLTNLVLLTSAAEWRVTSVNSDAITPTTVSVKPQSYVGASNVQPVVINNQMIYAAARGGHVRELAYSWQASGFVTGDLSLRAPHLFDNYTLVDMAYAKAPTPIVWAISSSGKLLGLTYVPEQQVGAWHQHDTDGTFESCCVVAEGDEDVLYVVVKRTVNGSSVRYIERQRSRLFTDQADAFFVDAGATFNGTNTSATTVTVSGGTTWGPADTLTITASAALFAYPGTTDVNDAIVFTDTDGQVYRLTILSTSSTTVASARVDKTLPAGYRNVATASYAFARDSISGLSWLEGKTVNILADGAVHPRRTVTSGTITLDRAASKVQVGLPITADIQTLPWYAQIDAAFGQGRSKNVNKVWLRVYRSSGIFAGPSSSMLTEAKQRSTEPYGTPPVLKSDEIQIVIDPQWNQSGQVFVRQADPLPLTLVSMTMEVAIGA